MTGYVESSIADRVAQAIYESGEHPKELEHWSELGEEVREYWRVYGRAALAAVTNDAPNVAPETPSESSGESRMSDDQLTAVLVAHGYHSNEYLCRCQLGNEQAPTIDREEWAAHVASLIEPLMQTEQAWANRIRRAEREAERLKRENDQLHAAIIELRPVSTKQDGSDLRDRLVDALAEVQPRFVISNDGVKVVAEDTIDALLPVIRQHIREIPDKPWRDLDHLAQLIGLRI